MVGGLCLPLTELHPLVPVTDVFVSEELHRSEPEWVAESEQAMTDRPTQTYRDLDAWNVAMDLAVAAYELASDLPTSERYELSSQIRRAATSVPSNIAEGQASGRDAVFLRHLSIALGSLGELDTQFEVGRRLRLLQDRKVAAIQEHIMRTRRLLYGLRRSLRIKVAKAMTPVLLLIAAPSAWVLFSLFG